MTAQPIVSSDLFDACVVYGAAFILLTLLLGHLWERRTPRNRRVKRKRSAVPRMYVSAPPAPDSRSSLEQFRKIIPRC